MKVALEGLASGNLALVVDADRDRGDFVAVARSATGEIVNEMVRHGRGLVAVAITQEQQGTLEIPTMPGSPTALVSVEAAVGVDTGISAADRAMTIRTVADPTSTPADLVFPGHVVPLVAATGGLLSRSGRVEAAVDLARLAADPAAAMCEVLGLSGELADAGEIRELGDHLRVPVVTLAALAATRVELASASW